MLDVLRVLFLLAIFWKGFVALGEPIVIKERLKEDLPISQYLEIAVEDSHHVSPRDIIDGTHGLEFHDLVKTSRKFGISTRHVWIKIQIVSQKKAEHTIYLENNYALMDRIEFYSIHPDGGYDMQLAGDQVPFHLRSIPYRYPIFKLNLLPGENLFYIKVKTHGSLYLGFELWEPESFNKKIRFEYSLVGALIGFQVIMAFYYTFLGIRLKKSIFLSLSFHIFTVLIVQMGFFGLSLEWLPDKSGIWLSNDGFLAFVSLSGSIASVFAIQFLNLRKILPKVYLVTAAFAFFGIFLVLCVPLVNYNSLAKITNAYSSLVSIVIIFAGIRAWISGFKPAKLYIIPWFFDMVILVMLSLKLEGYLPSSFLTEWGLILGNTVKVLLISFSLFDRYNFQVKESNDTIESLNSELKKYIEDIEQKVEERTERIRMIVDHVQSGFLIIDKNLLLQEGFTKSCHLLFGRPLKEGTNILEYIDLDLHESSIFKMAVEQVFDDKMPEIASLNQIPDILLVGERYLSISGSVIRSENNEISSIMFTINDNTELQYKEQESRENNILLRIIGNMNAFKEFIKTSKRVLKNLKSFEGKKINLEIKQAMHTLKGNAMIFGLVEVAKDLHNLEECKLLPTGGIEVLENKIKHFLSSHESFLTIDWENNEDFYSIAASQLWALKEMNQIDGPPREYVNLWLENAMSKTISDILGPVQEDISYLAYQLGKDIELKIEGDDIKVFTERSVFLIQSIIHLLRNAVIHGIEEDRHEFGKKRKGEISLTFVRDENTGMISITCQDDGRGMSIPQGYPDIEEFFRGKESSLSKGSIDLFSGRKVGVLAVINAVDDIDGSIEIHSRLGCGMTIKISFVEYLRDMDLAG